MEKRIIEILEEYLSVTDEWGGCKLASWQWGNNVLVAGIEDAAQKIVEEFANSAQQPYAACPEGETGRSCETCDYWLDGMCWSESCTDFSEWEQRPASA